MRSNSIAIPPALAALRLQLNDGQPVVLAFCETLGLGESAELERIRAELRGLGAALFLVARGQVYSFRPDDELDLNGTRTELQASAVAELRAACSFPAAADPNALALLVMNGSGSVVARHSLTTSDGMADLADALGIAGRQAIATQAFSLSRREVVLASLVGAFALLAFDGCRNHVAPARTAAAPPAHVTSKARKITLHVNGQPRELEIEPRVSLLDALRERLSLTGSKKGCDHGQCGACTVLVAGKRVNACLTLAIMVGDAPVTTIEGLAQGEQLHPMQAAFAEEDALQCGYCTPGQILSALGLVKENRAHSDAEVREHMSGNICRCGAYPNIIAAIQKARSAST